MQVALALEDVEQAREHRAAAEGIFSQLGAARDLSILKSIE